MQELKFKILFQKFKHAMVWKENNARTSIYANARMDTYHSSHGDSSSFKSGAEFSIPRVLLSSPDGVPDEDAFLHHSFLVANFFYRFHLRFLEFSTKDSSSCVHVVVHPDLLVDS